jgi:hypothetical protein
MSHKYTFLLILLVFSVSYSFSVYSKELSINVNSNSKNCSEIQFLLLEKREAFNSSILKRKSMASNIFSSLDSLSSNKNLKNKEKAVIEKFKEESKNLINDQEDLIFQIDSVLSTDCSKNKSLILEKIKKLNFQIKNLIKKDEKIINQFESEVKIIFKN